MRDPSRRFGRYLQHWWDEQLHGAAYPSEWLNGRNADTLASEFRRDTQFELTQASFLHRRPDESAVREIVDRLLPEPIESDSEVIVAAIVRAAGTARKVRATTATGAIITVFALVIRNILRGR